MKRKVGVAKITWQSTSKEGSLMSKFFNVRQTGDELGIHENTVRNLERRGDLKAIRLPGSGFRRFRKEDVDRMRREMWSQFAPADQIPTECRIPDKGQTLTDEDVLPG